MVDGLWRRIGFESSPYDIGAIPPNKRGDELLVGRDAEVETLKHQIVSSRLHPCLDGDNGVGKTSLVAVAGYQLRKDFARDQEGVPYLPIEHVFQLTLNSTAAEFKHEVLLHVARAFIEHHALLSSVERVTPSYEEVQLWLRPNSDTPFERMAFEATVQTWLTRCFPQDQSGGFICTLDNLELLKSTTSLRDMLEELRDSVLSYNGLRWVLCGSRGIVRYGTSSTRLEGRLASPMEIRPLGSEVMPLLISRRIAAFRRDPRAIPPVNPTGFRFIYDLLHHNLRNALRYAEDFSTSAFREGPVTEDPKQLDDLLRGWILQEAHAAVTAVHPLLRGASWEVLDRMSTRSGRASAHEWEAYDFASVAHFRAQLHALEGVGLVCALVHDGDRRRKLFEITPRGWMALYGRKATASLNPEEDFSHRSS